MSKVALSYGTSRKKNIIDALNLIDDDIKQAFSKKDAHSVLIKPNMVKTDNVKAATHVDALDAILEYLQKYKRVISKITIGEGPAGSQAQEGFANYRYQRLAERFKVDFMDLNKDSHTTVYVYQIDGEETEVRIAKSSIEYDYTISVTLPKTHETVIFSGGTKNYIMGSVIWDQIDDKIKVHGFSNRKEWDHYYPEAVKLMHRNLVRLAKQLIPDLNVIDGYVAMEGNGPVNGTLIYLGAAVAGTDSIATDSVAAKIMGFNPSDIGYLYYANNEDLGTSEISKIEILGANISDVQRYCKPHKNYPIEISWKKNKLILES
jgi:uncharacterized protein (DUF362 family)